MSDAQPYYLKDDDVIPNSALPLLLYPQVIDAAHANRASTFEQRFEQNGWTHTWCNGIYSLPPAHEVLGISCGSARVRLGGDRGVVLDVKAGDALLLPAGVGHQNLGASADLLVIGAYPKDQDWDLCRQARSQKELDQIARVPLPSRDPICGVCGGLNEHWPHA